MQDGAVKIRGLRWYVCGLLFIVTFINYIDRVSLGALAPMLQQSIGWDDAEFGWINFSFALAYAAAFPVAGRLIDRIGVKAGLAIGVVAWSVAAMGHALVSSVIGFALMRFVLGLGEATNFPACIKAIAEWFPKRQRSFATGIFNTGTNFAAMLQGGMLILATMLGWQAVFLVVGLSGFVWLALWLSFYREPSKHPRLAEEEREFIRDGQDTSASTKALNIPWQTLLRYREAWAFLVCKLLTDPVWWFYLTWLPTYLKRERDVSLASTAGTLAVIYLAADVGSIVGGWIPGRLMRAGWEPGRARLTALLVCAAGLPISALAASTHDLWLTVALISVATASHQAWSANLFTVVSDTFPQRAVASVVGFGAMCGGIGGLFMNLIAGGMLQWLGTYTPLFIFAGIMHPLAWITLRLLLRGRLREVTLPEEDARPAASPVLRRLGLTLLGGGALLCAVVVLNWGTILEATRHSVAAAAGGAAGALLIGLIGAALVYAARGQRVAPAA